MRFDTCLEFILQREGGYVDHPSDRGGATNQGIIHRVYDAWRINRDLPAQDVADIEPGEVWLIYSENYWRPVRAGSVPVPLDLVLFDTAVNHGVGRAIKILQRVIGADQDGAFGSITASLLEQTLAKYGIRPLVENYLAERSDFYARIIDRDPTQRVFARGWSNRMKELARAVA